uniref:Uncharacterized protein n=1 Tax=Anopheles atroparvus TaxID=41427 RepID=A0A182J4G4_ANOAO
MLLTISSEYFYIMFFGSFVEASEKEVVLANDDPDMFLLIMRYIYSGEIDLTFENMRDIFNIAQKFMLNELITLICNFILRHIEAESTLRLFSENRHYGFASVDDKCLEMISNNPLYYFNHVDLQNIDSITFDMILSLKQINCTDDQLHMALEIWAACRKQPDEVQALYKKIEDAKRTYNCFELRFFGQRRIDGYLPGELKFTLDSETPVSLYGIGVYIGSASKVISVELKIFQEDEKLGSESFEVANKLVNTVHVVNLCFEEIVMLPHKRYSIIISTPTSNDIFGFHEPMVYHNSIKLRFHTRNTDRTSFAIAHLLCKENPAYIAA